MVRNKRNVKENHKAYIKSIQKLVQENNDAYPQKIYKTITGEKLSKAHKIVLSVTYRMAGTECRKLLPNRQKKKVR